jgi:hypothetical protein
MQGSIDFIKEELLIQKERLALDSKRNKITKSVGRCLFG